MYDDASSLTFSSTLNKSFNDEFMDVNFTIIGLYVPVFMLALCANTLVIVVVIKYHYMRSVTNYFLVNLSAADLLVTLVCMPNAVWNSISYLWFLGDVACTLIGYLQCVSVGASIFTITAMAIDRYLAITQPIGFPRWFNKTSTTIVILILWLVSLLIFSPMLWILKLERTIVNETVPPLELSVCHEDWSAFLHYKFYIGVFWFAITFLVPGVLMIGAYSLMGRRLCSVKPPFDTDEGSASTQQGFRLVRERKRVAWILLLLALLFAACWLPYSIESLLLDTSELGRQTKWLLPYCVLLGHANSAINPIIYCFMTRNFRRSVKELLFRSRSNFTARRIHRGQYVDSGSASSQRWPPKVQLEPVLKIRPLRNNHQSSTRTTKTCAV